MIKEDEKKKMPTYQGEPTPRYKCLNCDEVKLGGGKCACGEWTVKEEKYKEEKYCDDCIVGFDSGYADENDPSYDPPHLTTDIDCASEKFNYCPMCGRKL